MNKFLAVAVAACLELSVIGIAEAQGYRYYQGPSFIPNGPVYRPYAGTTPMYPGQGYSGQLQYRPPQTPMYQYITPNAGATGMYPGPIYQPAPQWAPPQQRIFIYRR